MRRVHCCIGGQTKGSPRYEKHYPDLPKGWIDNCFNRIVRILQYEAVYQTYVFRVIRSAPHEDGVGIRFRDVDGKPGQLSCGRQVIHSADDFSPTEETGLVTRLPSDAVFGIGSGPDAYHART